MVILNLKSIFFYHVKIFQNLHFEIFKLTRVITFCFKKHPVLLYHGCYCCSSNTLVWCHNYWIVLPMNDFTLK